MNDVNNDACTKYVTIPLEDYVILRENKRLQEYVKEQSEGVRNHYNFKLKRLKKSLETTSEHVDYIGLSLINELCIISEFLYECSVISESKFDELYDLLQTNDAKIRGSSEV